MVWLKSSKIIRRLSDNKIKILDKEISLLLKN